MKLFLLQLLTVAGLAAAVSAQTAAPISQRYADAYFVTHNGHLRKLPSYDWRFDGHTKQAGICASMRQTVISPTEEWHVVTLDSERIFHNRPTAETYAESVCPSEPGPWIKVGR